MATMSRASPTPAPASAGPISAVATLSPTLSLQPVSQTSVSTEGCALRREGRGLFTGRPGRRRLLCPEGQVKLTVVAGTGKEAVLGLASTGAFVGFSCSPGRV